MVPKTKIFIRVPNRSGIFSRSSISPAVWSIPNRSNDVHTPLFARPERRWSELY